MARLLLLAVAILALVASAVAHIPKAPAHYKPATIVSADEVARYGPAPVVTPSVAPAPALPNLAAPAGIPAPDALAAFSDPTKLVNGGGAVLPVDPDVLRAKADWQAKEAQEVFEIDPATGLPVKGSTHAPPYVNSEVANADSEQRRQIFLSKLLSVIGKPYQRGKAGPDGFDSAGLVYWAAQQAGVINVPRTAQAQSRFGTVIADPTQRQPGDLIFFRNANGRVYHVGVFTGDKKMISAPFQGANVREENFAYYPDAQDEARRIFE